IGKKHLKIQIGGRQAEKEISLMRTECQAPAVACHKNMDRKISDSIVVTESTFAFVLADHRL
ncbi:unnamed protein product, partial [marine sediment metagenome]